MAPVAVYEAPHVQLGRLMIAARRRGLSFDDFWMEAIRPGKSLVMVTHAAPPEGCVRWPTDRNDRITWMSAINGVVDGWRRAYERRAPTRAELALMVIADEIGVIAAIAEEVAVVELLVAA